MSAGKPLGSRAVLLLDLDFSFLRRGRKTETQGWRSPRLARGYTNPSLLSLPAAQRDAMVQTFSFSGIFLTERQNFICEGFRIRSKSRSWHLSRSSTKQKQVLWG